MHHVKSVDRLHTLTFLSVLLTAPSTVSHSYVQQHVSSGNTVPAQHQSVTSTAEHLAAQVFQRTKQIICQNPEKEVDHMNGSYL